MYSFLLHMFVLAQEIFACIAGFHVEYTVYIYILDKQLFLNSDLNW